jgi:hypothetical protein
MKTKAALLALTVILLIMTSLTVMKGNTASTEALVYVSPAPPLVSSAKPNETFTIEVRIKDVANLYSWEVSLNWNATLLNVTAITEGSILKSRGATFFYGPPNIPLNQVCNNTEGALSIACSLQGVPATAAASGSGTLATVTFNVKAPGECTLHAYNTTLLRRVTETEFDSIPHTTQDGLFAYPIALIYAPKVSDGYKKAESYVTINVSIQDIHGLYGFKFKLNYSQAFLEVQSIQIPAFLNQPNTNETRINATLGVIYVNVTCKPPAEPVSGNGTLASLNFKVKADRGYSPLTLYDILLIDRYNQTLHFSKKDGYFTNIVHDIAIVSVDASPQQEVVVGKPVTITVVVQNRPWSTQQETFEVNVYAQTLNVNTTTVTNLNPGNSSTLICTWNTTGVIEGEYIVKAEASILADEINITDNERTYGSILVKSAPPPLAIPIEYIVIIVVVVVVIVVSMIVYKRRKKP